MPNYGKGKIYTIRCRTDDTLIYVGSTIQSLAVRWGAHKKDSRIERCKDILIYRTINNEWDNWYIELYELYPCSCKEELERKEGEIIRNIGTLNRYVAGRTRIEWRNDNKQQLLQNYKNNYTKNKDKIAEENKIKITCECGCIIRKDGLKDHINTKKHLDKIKITYNNRK